MDVKKEGTWQEIRLYPELRSYGDLGPPGILPTLDYSDFMLLVGVEVACFMSKWFGCWMRVRLIEGVLFSYLRIVLL